MDTALKNLTLAPYGIDLEGKPYIANPTQQKLLQWKDKAIADFKAGNLNSIRVLYLRGGVGSGKTRGMMAAIQEFLVEFPGLRVFWGRQDFKDLKLSVMDKFFETLPNELVAGKSLQYSWFDIRTEDKTKPSRILFNGLKDLSGLGSQEFGVIAVTEAHETSEMAYRTLKRRCRQSGMPSLIILESEPPNEDHWLTRLTNKALDEYDADIEVWELSTYENWKNLPEAYKGSLESMPASWKRKYLYGKPGFIPDGRPFYEGFKEQYHVGDYQFNTQRELILSWDFGFHHPAVSFHQLDESYWFILKELMGNEITIQAFCQQVKSFINMHFQGAKLINDGDPACLQKNDKSEKTSWEICKDNGFELRCRQSTYRTRKEIIDRKLSTLVNGKPVLRVDRSCKVIIDGFLGGYHFPEKQVGQQMTQRFEEPFHDDYYSHLMNTVEYVAINMFKPIEESLEKQQARLSRYRRVDQEVNAGVGY